MLAHINVNLKRLQQLYGTQLMSVSSTWKIHRKPSTSAWGLTESNVSWKDPVTKSVDLARRRGG